MDLETYKKEICYLSRCMVCRKLFYTESHENGYCPKCEPDTEYDGGFEENQETEKE